MNPEARLVCAPIGYVRVGRQPSGPRDGWQDQVAEIEILPAWEEALDGLEEFSHLWIIWWLDRRGGPPPLKVHPEGRSEMPLVGVLATRSPRRPNPLALTAVTLVSREGRWLYVRGLDAFEGTPVLDVKPYLRRGDVIPEAQMADWVERLWAMHQRERGK